MFYADFVRETSTAPGTATFDLDGAATGYQGFVAAGADGETVYYAASDGTDWEVGTGTVTDGTPDTLTRTVVASSNSNAAVNFAGEVTIDLVFSAPAANKTNFPKRALMSLTLSDGVPAGTPSSTGTWLTRELNQKDYDPGGIVTLSSNQFTLQPGTYRLHAIVPGFRVGAHKSRLRNITDAATTLFGTSEYSDTGTDGDQTNSVILGYFTITEAKTFEVQHYLGAAPGDGFGWDVGSGENEKYMLLEIEQLA